MPIQAIFRIDDGSYCELASNKINVPTSQEIRAKSGLPEGRIGLRAVWGFVPKRQEGVYETP